MSELIQSLPSAQLKSLLRSAIETGLKDAETLVANELTTRRLASLALSQGVYDAQDDTPAQQEHQEDSLWQSGQWD